jgi:hypothetical protein
MAKQVNRTACIIECTGLEAFIASNFRPSSVCVLVGESLGFSNLDAKHPLVFKEAPHDPDFSLKCETKRNWVIFQMCRAGYAPIGTPGQNDVRFKLEAFTPIVLDSDCTYVRPDTPDRVFGEGVESE